MAVIKITDNKTLPTVLRITSGGTPKIFKVSTLSKVLIEY